MAFLISQNNGGIIPGLEYLPAGAITPQIGMALVMTDGKLAACGATTRPQYICATAAESALTAGTIIPVFRVLEGMLFATTWSAAASAVNAGDLSDAQRRRGMQVTATTTSGVAEVVSMDGTAVGDTVYVRFPASDKHKKGSDFLWLVSASPRARALTIPYSANAEAPHPHVLSKSAAQGG
ncbi:MAG: hypothetical protein ACLTSG_14605 [Lachnospiraceae bacterium]